MMFRGSNRTLTRGKLSLARERIMGLNWWKITKSPSAASSDSTARTSLARWSFFRNEKGMLAMTASTDATPYDARISRTEHASPSTTRRRGSEIDDFRAARKPGFFSMAM
jgi:hypothetical protein